MNDREEMCQDHGVDCGVDCLECFEKNYCSKCKEGLVFNENEGCGSCKPGFHFNANYSICSPCLAGCLNCISSHECTVCDEANHFALNEGICSCDDHGFFPFLNDSFVLVCEKCKENCLECSDLTNCFKCSEGFEVQNLEQCFQKIACPPNCKNCAEATTCDECNEGFNLNYQGTQAVCEAQPARARKEIRRKHKNQK